MMSKNKSATATEPNAISRDTPVETARRFRAQMRPTLIKHNKDWLAYDGSAYQMIEDDTIESEILLFLQDCKKVVAEEVKDPNTGTMVTRYVKEPFNPKDADVNQVNKTLLRLFHVKKGAINPPFWLDGGKGKYAGLDPRNIISCKNGLLDITTRKLHDPTPQFFVRSARPIDYDLKAPPPKGLLKFLSEVLCDDELIALMQQWFGYLITTDTNIQRILYFQGRPRSGKGTIGRVLDQLIGADNVSSPTLGDLADRFGREDLVGKSMLKIPDMNTDNKQHLSEAATLFNLISGQDPVKIQRKFKGALDVRLPMHVVLIGNQFPNFGDHAAALADRLSVIPFRQSFAGKENENLTDELLAELPSILNWALDGLDSVRKAGKFLTPAASEKAKQEILLSGDPIRGFVDEECEVGPEFTANKDELFDRYQRHCIRVKAYPFSKDKFFSKLKTAVHSIRPVRLGSDGEREQAMGGIGLRGQGPMMTITKVFWLDQGLISLGYGFPDPEEAMLIDPITGQPVEVIDNEFD
jgi:putative DNA primase/helicase